MLCSPQRLDRPWRGQTEEPEPEALPPYDPGCYLCPGNARAGGARNPRYESTFAFDNDFPALVPSADAEPPAAEGDGLLRAQREPGRCRVLCYSPRHDLALSRMDPADIRRVVDACAAEAQELGASPAVRHVQVFENRGAAMGCSNPHPHAQVWATAHVPSRPARMRAALRAHHRAHGSDLLGDYLAEELRAGERLVCSNDAWAALVPFWAVWPFETMILPRRRSADLQGLGGGERDALADIVKRLTVRYDNVFRCPFPYSMGWQARPTDGEEHPEWRLHAAFFPPLLRSATVRKFLVGYELAAEPERDLTAEEAAARLRAAPERHYRDRPHGA